MKYKVNMKREVRTFVLMLVGFKPLARLVIAATMFQNTYRNKVIK